MKLEGAFWTRSLPYLPGVRGKNTPIDDVASLAYDAQAATPQQMYGGRFAWVEVDCKTHNELPHDVRTARYK